MTTEERLPKDEREWIEGADPEDVIVSTNSETDEARFELICAELGNKSARRILKEIANGENTSSLIAERTELSVQDVLIHLDKLVKAGLVEKADSKMPSFRGRKANSYRISRVAVLLMPNETANKLELKKLIQRKSIALLRRRLLSSIGLTLALGSFIFATLLQSLAVHKVATTTSGTVVVTDYSTALPVAIVATFVLSPLIFIAFKKLMRRVL
jgi:DNA-binding transcriptional ArsR family regulator